MKRLIIFLLISFIFLSSSAQAQNKGYYISGNAGVTLLSDAKLETNNIEFGDYSSNPGFNVGAALGYNFGSFRLEGEVAYHRNEMDEITQNSVLVGCSPNCVEPINGSISAISYMINGYYDFHLTNSGLVPYLGAGLGAATVIVNDKQLSGNNDDIVFAYQIAGGVGYKINPKMTLTAGYRYFATTESEFDVSGVIGFGVASTVFTEVESHEIMLGLRYQF